MEAKTLQASLRVLYTVNSNPQYILAKSSSPVPAIICSEQAAQSTANEPAYARAPLKACLAAVCDSSPELLHDPARDFSLYVLDPLEAEPLPTTLAHAPHNTSSPRGVAVALGLMSWALESTTDVFVTGTIIPNASPALEVVFALRETKRMPKPIPSFGRISAPGPSQPLNPLHAPQVARMSWLSTSYLQRDQLEQQTLTRSADFPELYIGPPRRAPGRPEGSTSSKSKTSSQASTSLPGADLSKTVESKSKSEGVRRRPKQKTKLRPPPAPPTHSPFTCGPLARHMPTGGLGAGGPVTPTSYHQSHPINHAQSHAPLYLQTQPYIDPTRNPLLGLLSGIPSTSSGNTNATPEQQAVFLSALQGLLASNPHLLRLATTDVGLAANSREQTTENKPMRGGSHADDEHDDTDSDIVVLDSSAIDTTAFRKPGHGQLAASETDTSPSMTNQESPMPRSQGIPSSPLPASTPPSGQEGTPASSQTSTSIVTSEAETPISKDLSLGQTERGNVTPSDALDCDMPSTPTPSRTRKRKLDKYIQDEAHSSTSIPPSPSMARTSSSRIALTAKRVPSSPTGRITSWSSPSTRLPSMLGSMRGMATSGSRLQSSPLSSSTLERLVSSAPSKNGNRTTILVSGPSKLNTDHPGNTDASSNVAPNTTTLKRRRTLNLTEFMEERESRKNAKVRKRPSSGHKLEVEMPANASQAALPHDTKMPSTSRHSQSSPPRPLFRSDPVASTLPASMGPPSFAPLNLPMTTSTCTGLSTSTSTAAPTQNPLKNFIVPAWARTSTAMLPRLSEEALARQRAEREAKKAQVSLRRREAAKAKRKRLRGADHGSKESSDEGDDDDADLNDPTSRTLHLSSSVARSAPLVPLPLPSLPVFASDAVEPIPSSPPQSHRQLVPPSVPSTPPRKPVSPVSAPHRTPSMSGPCSLFTPSGQDQESLFTPSTPSATRSLTRVTFTPRSPTMLHRSRGRKSPRKSVPQTPNHNSANRPTPRNTCSGRNAPFGSPSLAMRIPLTQTTMGTRAFLLPPPSPCTLRTPRRQGQVRSKMLGGSTPLVPEDPGITNQLSPSDEQNVNRGRGTKEDYIDMLGRKSDGALPGKNVSTPPGQCSPTRPTVDDGQGTSELGDVTSNDDAPQPGEEYAPSPLPPSSPPPASLVSSPTKHHDSDLEPPTTNNLVPDSDILLPSASDSDGPQGIVDTAWLSDDICTASWFTDSEASAWLTETEAWLTDTEGGPLRADSDGAWLSDSDAVFGDMSSLPLSSASNWLSDEADVDTDGEVGAMDGPGGEFDVAAFERAFSALVERGGRSVVDKDEGGGNGTTASTRIEPEFWESIRPLLRGNALNDTGPATGDAGESVNLTPDKVVQDIQELLNGLVGT